MAHDSILKKALDAYEKQLFSLKNVVGIGIVQADDNTANNSKEKLIAVYVDKKIPEQELPSKEHIPKTLEIEVGGKRFSISTTVIEQGTPQKEDMPERETL